MSKMGFFLRKNMKNDQITNMRIINSFYLIIYKFLFICVLFFKKKKKKLAK